MLEKKIIQMTFFIIIICLSFTKLYSQENTFIEVEQVKIIKEYHMIEEFDLNENDANILSNGNEGLPQSELMDELMKEGNENLLKQIQDMNKLDVEDDTKDMNEDDLEGDLEGDKTDEELENESEEEEEKKARATMEGLLYGDNFAYYQSIKDFYGYDIFLKYTDESKELGLLPNSNYVVGPDDELMLSVWGDAQFQRKLKVSKDGMIYIGELGLISVHGFKISELKNRLGKFLSKKYSTIAPQDGKPTTFFDIALTKLKSINIFVNGEVVVPGSFNLSSYATMLDALKQAQGVTAKGSLRDIILIRNGKVINHLDIYDYLMTGKGVSDLNLKNGDNIFVSSRLNTIKLDGEVLKPLKYELKEGENLVDLIKFSGGLLPTAAIDRIKIERLLPFEQRISPIVTTSIKDMKFTMLENGKVIIKPIELYSHDQVVIYATPRLLIDYVGIGGAVYRQGRFSFDEKMTLNDLLIKSGGLLSDAHIDRVELIRTYPDGTSEYKSLNLKKGDFNYQLNSKDSLYIHSEWGLKSKKIVIISGYVSKPGFYYLNDSTRVSDILFSKGGIKNKKQQARTFMKRADLVRYNDDGLTTKIIPINLEKIVAKNKSEDIFLKDRDHLKVYNIGIKFTEPKVIISGYVNKGGIFELSKDMTIEDLILKANGFLKEAYKEQATIFRIGKNTNSNDSISRTIKVDIDKDFFETGIVKKKSFFLRDNDHVVIRKNPDYKRLRNVLIDGEVMFPGVYALTHKGETLQDLISRAGGLTTEAFIEGAEFVRDSMVIVSDFKKAITGRRRNDITLKNEDKIHIPKRPGTVTVEGFIYTPCLLKFRKDWNLQDYIEAAGGTMDDYDYKAGNTVIYYPGGNANVDDGWLFSPNVLEGSKIIVPMIKRDPQKEWVSEIRGWLGIITSTLTVVVLVSALQ